MCGALFKKENRRWERKEFSRTADRLQKLGTVNKEKVWNRTANGREASDGEQDPHCARAQKLWATGLGSIGGIISPLTHFKHSIESSVFLKIIF